MEAFYKHHGFPVTKAEKVMQEPDESQEPAVGDIVSVEGGAAANQSYTMSDGEDEEEDEGAAAARRCSACGC